MLAVAALAGCVRAGGAEAAEVPGVEGLQQIRFILFENMDRQLAEEIAEGTEEVYDVPVTVIDETQDLPERGYNEERGQYLATALISALPAASEPGQKTLGITDADLYAPDLNFVFGQAQLPGDRAVMTTRRLREEFWGGEPDRDLLVNRAIKEAVHEIAHTLGLRHCEHPECVMHFSNMLADTDRKGRELCDECHDRLET
jgi:archaemetzincin